MIEVENYHEVSNIDYKKNNQGTRQKMSIIMSDMLTLKFGLCGKILSGTGTFENIFFTL